MVFKKRGQTGAIVVMMVIIAVFVTIYVMVLPENERDSLFDSFGEESSSKVLKEDILVAHPKRLDYMGDSAIEHSIPPFRVFTKKDITMLANENLNLYSTIISKTKKELSFVVDNVDFVENMIIGGNIHEGKGKLNFYLNEKLIYSSENVFGNIGPITISKEFLERNNLLVIEVANPGLAFWKKDYYNIDINVLLNKKDIDNQLSKNTFHLNSAGYNHLEYLNLNFDVSCDTTQSPLSIFINGDSIHSAVPLCDETNYLQISANKLFEGENELIFKINEGNYYIHNILLKSVLRDVKYPLYYFELSKEEISEINSGNLFVKAKIEFLDTVNLKIGELIINSNIESFNQENNVLIVDLSKAVKVGNNGIQIKPLRSLDVRELKVYFE